MTPMTTPTNRLFLFACSIALAGCGGGETNTGNDPSLLTVERRDLQITVKENAELQAQRETVVRSEVEGQSTIIFLIEEGRIVQQGEKLVELDSSELVDKRANQGITVAKAEASLAQARKALEILQKELTAKRRTAESNLRIAEMELEKLLGRIPTGGKDLARGRNADMVKKLTDLVEPVAKVDDAAKEAHDATDETEAEPEPTPAAASATAELAVNQVDPRRYAPLLGKIRELLTDADGNNAVDRDMGDLANKVLQQVDKIRLAMADLKFQETYFSHSQRLAQKKFITPNELEKDRIEFQRRLSQVGLAWNDLDLLVSYELFKTKEKLTQDVDNARLELARVLATNEADQTKADSSLKSAEAEYQLAKDRLDNLERQIKNATIFAPTPGLVIYARQERGRSGSEAIREGIQVRDRQDLLILPDTTRMQALVKVQEAVVSQVRVGQSAHLSVEAFPDRVFPGRVVRVAQQADSSSGWMNTDRKVYTTIVELDGENTGGMLRSRMAGSVTILVDHLHDVLAVPLQAVKRDRAANYVWKQSPQGPVPVLVEIGQHNSEHVILTKGIQEGDVVWLTTPPGTQPPTLDQPAVPMPTVPNPASTPTQPERPAGVDPTVNPTPRAGDAQAGNGNGMPNGERRPRQGGGMFGSKKLAEMSPEELEQFRAGLDRMSGMADRMRETNPDGARAMEESLQTLQAALQKNDLEAAQKSLDAMRAAMPRGGRRGSGGPGGGGAGGEGAPQGPGGGQGGSH